MYLILLVMHYSLMAIGWWKYPSMLSIYICVIGRICGYDYVVGVCTVSHMCHINMNGTWL